MTFEQWNCNHGWQNEHNGTGQTYTEVIFDRLKIRKDKELRNRLTKEFKHCWESAQSCVEWERKQDEVNTNDLIIRSAILKCMMGSEK